MLYLAFIALLYLAGGIAWTTRLHLASRPAEWPVAALSLSFLGFYGFPVLVGWITGFMHPSISLFGGAMCASSGIFLTYRNKDAIALGKIFQETANYVIKHPFTCAGWLLVTVILLLLLLIGSRLPYRIWDSVGYHANNFLRWSFDNKFILDSFGPVEFDPYYGAGEVYPNLKAVLPWLVLDLTGSLDGTAIVQWPWLVLLISALYAIQRRLELPRWTGPVGALFILLAPEILLQTVSGYADVVFVASQCLLLWALLKIFQESFNWQKLFFAAIGFGFLFAAKPTALPIGALMGLFYLGLIAYKALKDKNDLYSTFIWTVKAFVTTAIASLILAGPWYLHGWIQYGNPAWPVNISVAGIELFEGPRQSESNDVVITKYTGNSGLRAWWAMMIEEWREPSLGSWAGGMGAYAFIVGLPALLFCFIVALGSWRTKESKNWLFVLLILFLFIVSTNARTLPRQNLYFLFFMAPAFGLWMSHSRLLIKGILIAFFAILGIYNIYRTVPGLLYRYRPPEEVAYALLSGQTRWVQHNHASYEFSAFDWWREIEATEDDKLAIVQSYPIYYWPIDLHVDIENVAPLKDVSRQGGQRWLQALVADDFTHLFVPYGSAEHRIADALLPSEIKAIRRLDSSADFGWMMEAAPDAVILRLPKLGGATR